MLVIKTSPDIHDSITETQKPDEKGDIHVIVPEDMTVIDAKSVIQDVLDRHAGPVWCGECHNIAVMALVMEELKLRERDSDWVKDPTIH